MIAGRTGDTADPSPADSPAGVPQADVSRVDLRLVPAAAAAWAGAALGVEVEPTAALAASAVVLTGALVLVRTRHHATALVALACAGSVTAAAVRVTAANLGPVSGLAAHRAEVEVLLDVVTSPQVRRGDYGRYALLDGRVKQVTRRGTTTSVRSPVVILAPLSWRHVRIGQTIAVSAGLAPAHGDDVAALLVPRGPPRLVASAGPVARAVESVHLGLRRAVRGLEPAERGLVPAVVVGDDSRLPDRVSAWFDRTGLTHLTAVSGTNLTLLLVFLLGFARLVGVRGRGLTVLGLLGVVGFVLLARPQPSVLRAAVMGLVGLVGLSPGARPRAVRALAVAVLALVLVDPWLARSVGFVLSVTATAGIVVLGSRWRVAVAGWAPGPVADALSVALAAQLVCTPILAVLSGQVSLAGVLANVLVAPAVGPLTVLGLAAAVAATVSPTLAAAFGWCAGLPAWWLTTVAEHGARLPGAALPWPTDVAGVAALALVCGGLALILPRLLSRRWACLVVAGVGAAVLVRPLPTPGWPPDDWLLVACAVGQGDALALNVAPGRAVVVDAGPDPAAVDGCLDRLGVETLPLVVLSHLHADHVNGLPGVLSGRRVGEVQIGPLLSPVGGLGLVTGVARRQSVPISPVIPGEIRAIGQLSWRVLWPASTDTAELPVEGSPENNASIVMAVRTHGTRILLTGDVEPPAQERLAASGANLRADVLKVPHHGSRYQDAEFLAATGARIALVSVGPDNDYGHPAPSTLRRLANAGMRVWRTDRDGDIAVVDRGAGLAVVTCRLPVPC